MTAGAAWSKKRLLVPRWKFFTNQVGTGELSNPKSLSKLVHSIPSPEYLKRLEKWRFEPSLLSAAELVEATD